MIELAEVASPVGTICVAVEDGRARALGFGASWNRCGISGLGDTAVAARNSPAEDHAGVVQSLRVYLAGQLDALAEVPVALSGTPFQQRVWKAMQAIPPGETVSYGELAAELSMRRGARAVGSAAGANPIAIVVPCHRVVRSDAQMGGYNAGADKKQWLLEHERSYTT